MAVSSAGEGWKGRALLVGGVLGALAGVGAAMLFIRRAERSGGAVELSPGEGIRLGVLVLGLLREVALLGDPKN